MNVRDKIDKLDLEKKSLPNCARKREIENQIRELQKEIQGSSLKEPSIIVKYSEKPIGRLDYDNVENSWIFKSNDGSSTEVGLHYNDARLWASMNGYKLKVESI